MQTEEIPDYTETPKESPFNNLFLARGFYSGKNEWWMYLVVISISFLVGYLVVGNFIALFFFLPAALNHGIPIADILKDQNILFNAEKIGIDKNLHLAITMIIFVGWITMFSFLLKRIAKKTLTSVISGYEKIRWKRYFTSFSIWSLFLIISIVIGYYASPEEVELKFDASRFFVLLLVAAVFIPIQTATEEIIFRGYLMQGLSQWFKNGIVPLLLTSICFGLMHSANPEVSAHGFWIMMPYYIMFGLFLGILTLLDEGLELALGIHCANNLISSLLITSKNSVLKTDSIFLAKQENPGGEFMLWMIMASLCFGILYLIYRWKNWKLIIK